MSQDQCCPSQDPDVLRLSGRQLDHSYQIGILAERVYLSLPQPVFVEWNLDSVALFLLNLFFLSAMLFVFFLGNWKHVQDGTLSRESLVDHSIHYFSCFYLQIADSIRVFFLLK